MQSARCLRKVDEYCSIGYIEGIADALNSIRGFNMSCQVVVQSLSQWQEKYPGKEWENQLATFDQTLYMGCNDWTSANYISKKCGKVTISQTSSHRPQLPLFASVYANTRYSQTWSNTQRELMQPDEILRLDRRQCTALFQGRKPAPPKQPAPEDEPDPSQGLEYQLANQNKGLGIVELDADGMVGGDDEEEESPPGR